MAFTKSDMEYALAGASGVAGAMFVGRRIKGYLGGSSWIEAGVGVAVAVAGCFVDHSPLDVVVIGLGAGIALDGILCAVGVTS